MNEWSLAPAATAFEVLWIVSDVAGGFPGKTGCGAGRWGPPFFRLKVQMNSLVFSVKKDCQSARQNTAGPG